MMKKTIEILTTVLFTAFIGLFGILHVVLPDATLSESERRALAKLPDISVSSVLDGVFMQNLEKYLPDQFPLREQFRTVKAYFELASGRLDTSDIYTHDGHLTKLDYLLNENSVVKAGNKLEKIYALFPDATPYLSVIPQKDWYMDSSTYPKLDVDRLTEILTENAPSYSYVDITGTLTLDSYYKTDSHWRQELIGDTVSTLTDAMGLNVTVPSYTVNEITGFNGVYVGQAALPVDSESIYYLTNDATENAKVTCVGAECDAVYTLGKLSDEKSLDMYDVFLGGPVPLVTIENPNAQTDRALILVRDSFGSSLAPLMVDYYETIHVVDLRYIASQVLPGFVQADENTDLLVLLSTGVLGNSEMLKVQ